MNVLNIFSKYNELIENFVGYWLGKNVERIVTKIKISKYK